MKLSIAVGHDDSTPVSEVTYNLTEGTPGAVVTLDPGAMCGLRQELTLDDDGNASRTLTIAHPVNIHAFIVEEPATRATAKIEPLGVKATKTAPDTIDFTITAPKLKTAVLDPGDGASPITLTIPGYSLTYPYTYQEAGHYFYDAVITAPRLPVPNGEKTLLAISERSSTLESISEAIDTLSEFVITEEKDQVEVEVDVGYATIWVEVINESPLPYIRVYSYIRTDYVATWSITRIADNIATVIAVGDVKNATSLLEDREAPLGIPIFYRLDVTLRDTSEESATSETVGIYNTQGCFLSDPGTLNVIAVEVQSWDERQWDARSTILTVLGRADPIVLSDTHTWPSGTLTVLTRSDFDLARLEQILTGSRTILLRTQPGESIKTIYAAVGSFTERRLSNSASDQRRLTDISIQEITPVPAAARPVGTTLLNLSTAAPTLAELADVAKTLLELSAWRPSS